MLLLLLLSAGSFLALMYLHNIVQVRRIHLRVDSGKGPRNPARGFYIQIPSHSPERLADYSEELSLCLLAYDLYNFRSGPIEEEKLLELETFLEEAEGTVHIVKSLPHLEPVQTELFLSASALNQADTKRVGLRISQRDDPVKLPQNCAALVNEGISFENGIHYLLTIEDGIIYPES